MMIIRIPFRNLGTGTIAKVGRARGVTFIVRWFCPTFRALGHFMGSCHRL
jgi:hypothetical protein